MKFNVQFGISFQCDRRDWPGLINSLAGGGNQEKARISHMDVSKTIYTIRLYGILEVRFEATLSLGMREFCCAGSPEAWAVTTCRISSLFVISNAHTSWDRPFVGSLKHINNPPVPQTSFVDIWWTVSSIERDCSNVVFLQMIMYPVKKYQCQQSEQREYTSNAFQ